VVRFLRKPALPCCKTHQFVTRVDPTFAHGTADMLFDRMHTYGECCSDLHVVCPMAEQDDDITLAIAQQKFVVCCGPLRNVFRA
jgi:hypothetical protein